MPAAWACHSSMLYLSDPPQKTDETPSRYVPVAELTALALERALLAADDAARGHELAMALARDPAVAKWAMRSAERRLGRPVHTIDEAAASWAGCLAAELATLLTSANQSLDGLPVKAGDRAEEPRAEAAGIEWRLPTLAAKIFALERQLAGFQERLEHEKLESLKGLAYGASHEINNPLANIAARAQTLLQDEVDPERRRKLSAIHRQALRAHEMIADLMLFARPPKLNPAACDLRQLARQVVDEMRDLAREHEIQLACETGDQPIELLADATQLGVAIQAVVTNALEAVGNGGHVEMTVQQTAMGSHSWVEVAVRDDGPGISDEVRRHLFDPFFSGREAGRGLGFGLSKCWRIVTDHGGQVIVRQPSGRGAEVAILLPLSAHAERQS